MRRIFSALACVIVVVVFPYSVHSADGNDPAGTVGEERKAEKQAERQTHRQSMSVEQGGALLPSWRIVVEPFFEYDHISSQNVSISGFTIFEAILIGQVQVQKLKRDIFMPGVTLRLGLKNAELNVRVPYLFRTDQAVFPGSGQQSGRVLERNFSDRGIGDVELYLYYHLLKEGTWAPWVPDAIVRAGVKFPTGIDPYGLTRENIPGLGLVPTQFPTGTGCYGTSLGVTFIKSVEPAVVFLNLAYFYNFARDVGVAGSPPTDFGTIKIGNTIEYSVGLIFAIQERLSLNFAIDQRITGKTKQNGNPLVDTQINAVSFNIGATYTVSKNFAVDMTVGIGLTPDAPGVSFLTRFPISF
jgi:hypothetical protein